MKPENSFIQDGDDPFAAPPAAYEMVGSVRYYHTLEQGTQEWLETRLGVLTASEVKHILTPTLKLAANDKERSHLYELLSQRITKFVEPHFMSEDMMRGHEDEVDACILYSKEREPVEQCGFITNDKWGFTLGYSPDGLVGSRGLVECKSRRPKFQVQTIIENVVDADGKTIPTEYVMQHQGGMLISERDWIDFISYSGGLPMAVIRVHPDPVIQNAIVEAAGAFEDRLAKALEKYTDATNSRPNLFATERKIYEEISL